MELNEWFLKMNEYQKEKRKKKMKQNGKKEKQEVARK